MVSNFTLQWWRPLDKEVQILKVMLLLVAFGGSNCESQKHVTDIGFWAQPILNQMLQSANVETLLPQLLRFIDPPVTITIFAVAGLFPGCSHKGEGVDSVKRDA